MSVYLHWRYQLLLLFYSYFTLSIVIKFIVMSSFLYPISLFPSLSFPSFLRISIAIFYSAFLPRHLILED